MAAVCTRDRPSGGGCYSLFYFGSLILSLSLSLSRSPGCYCYYGDDDGDDGHRTVKIKTLYTHTRYLCVTAIECLSVHMLPDTVDHAPVAI